MKKLIIFLIYILPLIAVAQLPAIKFEETKGRETPTYQQIIEWWTRADWKSEKITVLTMGETDSGFPLHLAVISNDGSTDFEKFHAAGKNIILINNGIHPGEPDGIDASMLLVRDILSKKIGLPDHIVLAIIPVYNIGGCLNRSANYRVDQNGPEEFGFRGNARNYDLNRDFIKSDSRNARAFAEIFHLTDPDIFIDNHVSNGADYQHVMTLISSQHNKLGGDLGKFMNTEFEPALYRLMEEKGFPLVPYVNHFGTTPDKGWPEFWDSPRYGSGYGSLFQTFSFVPETHMLKPYPQRVQATYALMQSFIEFTAENGSKIKELRHNARAAIAKQNEFPVEWKLDTSRHAEITYRGYESRMITSEVSGLPRLYYDRSKPYTISVPFYNHYIAEKMISKPQAYILPQGWWQVAELLQLNGVQMRRLQNDTTISVEYYRIENYSASARVYEGHHPNGNVEVSKHSAEMKFRKGDWWIPMNQKKNRFIIEVLEPEAEDSYFTWNFFDPILGQKEGFSSYVFEETAAEYLKSNPELRARLEERRTTDSNFAKSARAQLDFVYRNSPYYEPDHMRYPVVRVE